jgi:hypothetical protein
MAWKQKGGQLLWLKGIPGAGKTVLRYLVYALFFGITVNSLSSTVIDHLQKSTDVDIQVAYYFFDFSNSVKRTARGCIQSLVLQFCEQADMLPESIVSLYDASQGGSFTIDDLTNALAGILKISSNYSVVVDALDECFEKDERRLLFKCLKEIKSKASDTRFFISSRAEPDIESTLTQLQAKGIFMDEKNVDEDIRLYVRSQLEHDDDLKKWSKRVKDDIEDRLMKKAKGM